MLWAASKHGFIRRFAFTVHQNEIQRCVCSSTPSLNRRDAVAAQLFSCATALDLDEPGVPIHGDHSSAEQTCGFAFPGTVAADQEASAVGGKAVTGWRRQKLQRLLGVAQNPPFPKQSAIGCKAAKAREGSDSSGARASACRAVGMRQSLFLVVDRIDVADKTISDDTPSGLDLSGYGPDAARRAIDRPGRSRPRQLRRGRE